ncbi:hypothetical protein FDB15_16435 [Clostridium botulinum]|uniref:hypothetical protein n=1 Tax=unclassified Clostridium TaxID=2614128 RepID=UPI0005009F5D|nr:MULTISPECIES: hypothetical protein [unclassified Clostridium]KFX54681.1 hypothetical protein KU40_13425 [Clostridium botulinum]MBY6780457.1 hypothetical protein [Clostridium botulinum]MBY6853594.1 hypothetical protein [Clostridium botulinum]MBY7009166.1 hypothetical protein [Clostridium botulinum]NFF24616.1 hypothetical protein [Clostridium botulinum]
MEKYNITVVSLLNKEETNLIIKADEAETSDDILLFVKLDNDEIVGGSEIYFEAFKQLKDKLLDLNYGIKCKGSLPNVVQSRMAANSDKIYVVELGKQALRKNLVSIYEYADIFKFSNSKEQDEFAEQWYSSL